MTKNRPIRSSKKYVRETILRLELKDDNKLMKIMEFFGGVSMIGAIRKLIRDKKIN